MSRDLYMQVSRNHLKNNQTEQKKKQKNKKKTKLCVKPDGTSALIWGAGCGLVHILFYIWAL